MSHDPFDHSDAAYVLGALLPSERQEFEEHLRTCEVCSRSVAELAGLPGLLAGVDGSAFDDPERLPVPDTLLPSLRREVRRSRARRRLGVGIAAAAVTLVVGGIGVAVVEHESSSAPGVTTSASQRWTEVRGGGPLQANLRVDSVAWGTRLRLTCDYRVSGPYPELSSRTYALVVHTRDGRSERVASWRVLPNRITTVVGASAARTSDITSVDIRSDSGRPVMRFTS
jgi:hypothetical protein